MEMDMENTIQVVTDSHWMEDIKKGQVDSEIATLRAKEEAGETSRYAVHEGTLYYLSGSD